MREQKSIDQKIRKEIREQRSRKEKKKKRKQP